MVDELESTSTLDDESVTEPSNGSVAVEPGAVGTTRLNPPAGVTRQIFWSYLSGFIAIHLLALLAFVPWLFSWTGVIAVFVGNCIFGSIGINLAYHRLLTHSGLTLPKWLEHTFALCGVCCLQDAPARWVAIHRMHHQHSDKDPDPHSPLVDFFWGHVGLLIYQNKYFGTPDFYSNYVRDILKDPLYYRLERGLMFLWIYLGHAVLFYLAGFLIGWWMGGEVSAGVQFGASLLVWGVFVRTVYVWHITWAVNSVTHCWGYRNYEVSDESRNNWII